MSGSFNGGKMPLFDYERESDTLTIWNGGQAAGGFDITPGFLIVFFDYDYATPIGLSLTPAAKLLGKRLPIESIANTGAAHYRNKLDLKIEYDAAKDTLWLVNSRPTEISCPLIKDAVTVWFQAGGENVQNKNGKIPSGIVIYDAVKRLEPVILADLAETSASAGHRG